MAKKDTSKKDVRATEIITNKKEEKINAVIDMIVEGKSWEYIAKSFGCSPSSIHEYCSKSEYSARVRDALEYSASTYADKAEDVLIKAKKDSVEMMRARELAQHYRWKAGKRAPTKYGDKLDVTTNGENVNNSMTWNIELVKPKNEGK